MLLGGGPPTPLAPPTPIRLDACTPRTRGLHAELQSWLSPLIGDGEQVPTERKPPAWLPQLTKEERDFGSIFSGVQAEIDNTKLLTADWSAGHDSSTSTGGGGADPLNTSQLAAEAVLESLMRMVVDETDAKFAAAREGSDLAADLAAMARDVDGKLTSACAKAAAVSVKDVMAMVKAYITKVGVLAAEDAADAAAAYAEARRYLRRFGVEHLQAVWAEAELSRNAKFQLNAQALGATIERVRESEGGAIESAKTAREARGTAEERAVKLGQEVTQLKEQLAAESTRADAAEAALIRKFEQMDEISTSSFQSSRRLLMKVEWLTGCWKAECGKSNRLDITLRKLKGQKETEEAKKRPVGKEETPSEFAEKMKGLHKEVEGVRSQVVRMTEHQNDIRIAILTIRRDSAASRAFRENGAISIERILISY